MSARLMVCLLLLGASLPVIARDARAEPGNEAPCPPAAGQAEPVLDAGSVRGAPAASATKSRTPANGGGEVEQTVRGTRWHSFLPGMFR